MEAIRVLLIDDHAIVRSGLRLLLEKEADIVVIGEAANGESGYTQALGLRPDVILMDITLPDLDGIQVTRQICEAWPAARVVALTMHGEDTYLPAFLAAGGMGYVRKSAADRDVVTAIRTVAQGDVFLQPEGMQFIARSHREVNREPTPPSPDILSEREKQVLELTVRGFTSGEIGDQLAISPRTVETYRARVMEKLGLEHKSQLVDYALRYRLLG